jgi:hypothetical protein
MRESADAAALDMLLEDAGPWFASELIMLAEIGEGPALISKLPASSLKGAGGALLEPFPRQA